MVMEVETSPKGIPSKRTSMSLRVATATPSFPTSPSAMGLSLSRPMSVGRSKAVESPVCPSFSRYLKRALVSSAVPIPAEHAHGPEPAAVHGGLDPARVGVFPWPADVALEIGGLKVLRRVEAFDGQRGHRGKLSLALRGLLVVGTEDFALPSGAATALRALVHQLTSGWPRAAQLLL